MKFKRIDTEIEGLFIVVPEIYGDERGFFMECYSKRDFEKLGIDMEIVQENHSMSNRGVLRGMHFQKNYPQRKIVRVISGRIYDVVIDLREKSSTYGKWYGIELSEKNRYMLHIPKGFAHGFLTLEDNSQIIYRCDEYYHPEDEDGIIWRDESVGIDWKLQEYEISKEKLILSEKDKKWSGL